MNAVHQPVAHPYRPYVVAWLVLLAITLAMVASGSPPLLLAGMGAKAAIIALWFMHLRHERLALGLAVAISVVALTLILYGLMIPDGLAA